jgi:hypothetical protein
MKHNKDKIITTLKVHNLMMNREKEIKRIKLFMEKMLTMHVAYDA